MANDKNNRNPGKLNERPGREKSSSPLPPRSSKAALVWLVILLGLAALVLFQGVDSGKTVQLTQSEFENLLSAGQIVTAEMTNESERTYTIEGKFRRLVRKAADKKEETPAVKPEAKTEEKPEGEAKPKVQVETIVRTEAEPGHPSTVEMVPYRTRVIYSDNLDTLLKNTKVTIRNNNAGFWNFILIGLLPVLLLIGVIYFFMTRQMKMAGRGAMEFGKSKARMIPPDELNVKFDDIAGADEAKEEIREVVEYLKDPLRFLQVGGQIPKGCLLVGEPGTGKTLLAKAVACEAGVPFFSISGSDFVEMFVGVGASRVRDMFEQARRNTPCLIFIDEIDAVGRSRFSGWGGGHDEREQTLNAMLVEMDGLESRNGVIVLAATNRPDVLDQALLRPGRFDRQVVMDLPDIAGRRKILDVHIKKIKVATIDLDVIARTTPGFSGADLANLCNEAALLAVRRNREAVEQADLEEARDKVSYGAERRSRKITERERRLTAYHEAGHALIALHNDHCTPIHKVTIIPRGQAYLGATFTMPKEDVYTRSKLELEADMEMDMGGRAAEELVIGDVTTGASADIRHLTNTARRMVCLYGMSPKIGPARYDEPNPHPGFRMEGESAGKLSEETAREIDLEVRRLIHEAMEKARKCIRENRGQLEKLAQALLERETLSIDEINVLLGLTPVENPQPAVDLRPVDEAEHGTPESGV